jgi:hypothetical protein
VFLLKIGQNDRTGQYIKSCFIVIFDILIVKCGKYRAKAEDICSKHHKIVLFFENKNKIVHLKADSKML